MVGTDIKAGDYVSADKVMNAIASIWNDTAQNLFNAAYLGFDSRLSGNGSPSNENVIYSIFTSDDAYSAGNFEYNTTYDYYNTPNWTAIQDSNYYAIDVYASSSSGVTPVSNVNVIRLDENIWRIYSNYTNLETARALVLQTLFKPDTIGNAETAQIITKFTGITAIKTSESSDIGGRMAYAYGSWRQDMEDIYGNAYITATFSDTANNIGCRGWGQTTGNFGAIGGWYKWGKFNGVGSTIGTSANSYVYAQYTGGNTSSYGTDTSSKGANNPSNFETAVRRQNNDAGGYVFGTESMVFYKAGSVSWNIVTGTSKTLLSSETYDFIVDGGLPAMTESDFNDYVSTLIFKDTVESCNNAIPIFNSIIDATSSQQISISGDGGLNWTNSDNGKISRFTAGTDLWRKITITRTDLSKEDKVTEHAIKYNLY